MERNPLGVRKGVWTPEEDILLRKCIESYGEGKWHLVPPRAGLNRCRKSCRLRWLNYLKPNIKRGRFTKDEVDLIIRLHNLLGNRWSLIAGRLPGRTANDVKNLWNSHIEKKLAAETLTGRVIRAKKSIALRPRPRTFSELRRQQETSRLETGQTGNPNKSNDDLPPAQGDDCRSWWSNLLEMASGNGIIDRSTGLVHDGSNLNQQGEADFPINVDIWKLLCFGDQG